MPALAFTVKRYSSTSVLVDDLSGYVLGLHLASGRSSPIERMQAATAQLVIDNASGRFDIVGVATAATPASYPAGASSDGADPDSTLPELRQGQNIRITETTYGQQIFSGKVVRVAVDVPTGSRSSIVTVDLVDAKGTTYQRAIATPGTYTSPTMTTIDELLTLTNAAATYGFTYSGGTGSDPMAASVVIPSGTSWVELADSVAEACGAIFYVTGNGAPRYISRGLRMAAAAAAGVAVTFGDTGTTEDTVDAIGLVLDDDRVVNRAEFTAAFPSGSTQVATRPGSILAYGQHDISRSAPFTTSDLLGDAKAYVARYGRAIPEVRTIQFVADFVVAGRLSGVIDAQCFERLVGVNFTRPQGGRVTGIYLIESRSIDYDGIATTITLGLAHVLLEGMGVYDSATLAVWDRFTWG